MVDIILTSARSLPAPYIIGYPLLTSAFSPLLLAIWKVKLARNDRINVRKLNKYT